MTEKPTYEELEKRVLKLEREAVRRKRAEEALQERIKELKCLYALSNLIDTEDNLLELLQETVDLIPESWQYPEITTSQILLDGKTYRTYGQCELSCEDCPHMFISQLIFIKGHPSGEIRVCYKEKKPEAYEGPFLLEERYLINAIAERLGRVMERRIAEEVLYQSREPTVMKDHSNMIRDVLETKKGAREE
jgi:hypothetical protein